ncbi:MAG: Na+/H+ antiporter subunit E [Alphaproteobacteria bacterium]|nr:Na+/H+ antiporter subunit E [Alphaproteobacteria bacterium]
MNVRASLVHGLGLWLVVFALWLLLSGHYVPLLISFGVVSSLLIVWIAARLDVIDHESIPLQIKFGYVGYLAWLGKEITKSNIDVAKLILHPKLPISPVLLRVPATQITDVGKVIYANSITLTPGTVSIEVEPHEILVHAITREAADGLASGDMDRRVDEIEVR